MGTVRRWRQEVDKAMENKLGCTAGNLVKQRRFLGSQTVQPLSGHSSVFVILSRNDAYYFTNLKAPGSDDYCTVHDSHFPIQLREICNNLCVRMIRGPSTTDPSTTSRHPHIMAKFAGSYHVLLVLVALCCDARAAPSRRSSWMTA